MAVPFWSGSLTWTQDHRSENNRRLVAATIVRQSDID